jgi:GWxTD domain-containing protein
VTDRARIGSVLAVAVAVGSALLAGCGSGGVAPGAGGMAGLVNFELGPQYSHWLVGPVARMASPEEIQGYLGVTGDFAALDFIEAFWARRDPDPQARGNPVREAFELRVGEADRLYGEAGTLGRRTPRGTLYVLHGAPATVEFEIAPEGGEPIEIWRYPAAAPPGLDGRAPERLYWFRKQGELTRPYLPGARRPVRSIGG